MTAEIAALERYLASKNKRVRLNAIKLMLRHPGATPLQIVRCLCSEDNRNFEFLEIFDLHEVMRQSWKRLHGVEDPDVYEYIDALYSVNPEENGGHVVHILELLRTRQALDMLDRLRATVASEHEWGINLARSVVSLYLKSNGE